MFDFSNPKVFVCSPFRGPGGVSPETQKVVYERNRFRAESVLKTLLDLKCVPIVPHVFYSPYISDEGGGRTFGLTVSKRCIPGCDFALVYDGEDRSEGMLGEIEEFDRLRIPYYSFYDDPQGNQCEIEELISSWRRERALRNSISKFIPPNVFKQYDTFWITGAPGVGKSTTIEWMEAAYDVHPVRIGALLREKYGEKKIMEMSEGNPFAPRVLDGEVLSILNQEFSNAGGQRRIAIDGIPRDVRQVEWVLKFSKFRHPVIIDIQSYEDIIQERLQERSPSSLQLAEAATVDYNTKTMNIFSALMARGVPIIYVRNDGK